MWRMNPVFDFCEDLFKAGTLQSAFYQRGYWSTMLVQNQHLCFCVFPPQLPQQWSLIVPGSTHILKRYTERALWSYTLVDAQLQPSVLNHVNAVVRVAWPEERLPLVHLDEQHVTTKLQEEGLLKVTQDPFIHNTQFDAELFPRIKKTFHFWRWDSIQRLLVRVL